MTSRDDFEYWLSDMPDALERFFATLPENVRAKLDFSISSLDVLEAWILQKYPGNQKMRESSEAQVVDGLARYIGETLRKLIGGRWNIRLDDPSYVYHGLPELTGFSERSTPVSPHTLATAAADRRTGTYLSGIAGNMIKRYGAKKS